ncbi:MAG: hypothetical protein ABIZ95_07320 [Pyrinomonadaceae bacterium]
MTQSITDSLSQSFRCPNCNEYINTDARECRFCSHPIDAETALRVASEQERINQACNDASHVRNLAGVTLIMTVLFNLISLGISGPIALVILNFSTVGLVIRWEVKYASIRTLDPDFAVAKRNRLIALGLWLASASIMLILVGIGVAIGLNKG